MPSAFSACNASSPSFRGRERSDRRFAPSECERSPESITTGGAVMKVVTLRWHILLLGVMDSGLARQIGTADLPCAPE